MKLLKNQENTQGIQTLRIHEFKWTQKHKSTRTRTRPYAHTRTHTYTHAHTHTPAHTRTHAHAHIRAHTRTHTHTCTCTRTHLEIISSSRPSTLHALTNNRMHTSHTHQNTYIQACTHQNTYTCTKTHIHKHACTKHKNACTKHKHLYFTFTLASHTFGIISSSSAQPDQLEVLSTQRTIASDGETKFPKKKTQSK